LGHRPYQVQIYMCLSVRRIDLRGGGGCAVIFNIRLANLTCYDTRIRYTIDPLPELLTLIVLSVGFILDRAELAFIGSLTLTIVRSLICCFDI
jgi:hypothetical protein